ncbi:Zn(II)2Cys6 transcription factor [Aspergillus nomiae NRRL 13137]|uniref:Zn(II)2Cys6 transcription factor n=1 Tax=Aspergillus nomiae NRRL (strain ATCC 15546 / NRRL 13137 / CBS 260.88 / M93) TaxID=1509407 RepID=A0A0L1IQX4_ASPN3|nr:Zn(II)2Cys6 transcription factor [Aspergillus nomiae NRRL 13137]KNG81593.1 Zn(II)2Cys6 transcription factor [Aspergillus nomiae NRRL 13137]
MSTNTIATSHPQNPISCEPCRQKKCKCDRLLTVLEFILIIARGLPQGYITHIEHRLAATEAALFSMYSQVRAERAVQPQRQSHVQENTLAVPVDVVASSRGSRMESMAEWQALPLRTRGELERWWGVKRGAWGVEIDDGGCSSGGFGQESEKRLLVEDRNETNPGGRDANLEVDSGKMTRAERLARLESRVYF